MRPLWKLVWLISKFVNVLLIEVFDSCFHKLICRKLKSNWNQIEAIVGFSIKVPCFSVCQTLTIVLVNCPQTELIYVVEGIGWNLKTNWSHNWFPNKDASVCAEMTNLLSFPTFQILFSFPLAVTSVRTNVYTNLRGEAEWIKQLRLVCAHAWQIPIRKQDEKMQ